MFPQPLCNTVICNYKVKWEDRLAIALYSQDMRFQTGQLISFQREGYKLLIIETQTVVAYAWFLSVCL